MRRALLTALLVSVLGAVVLADYKDTYRKAIQARNRGRWEEVARYMAEAINEQPKDTGERIQISGMDFVPYIPNFYRGLALANTNDCVGAIRAWTTSESQGGIRYATGGDRNAFNKLRPSCEAVVNAANKGTPPPNTAKPPVTTGPDPATVNAAAQTAEGAIARAQDAERAVSQLSADALLNKVWSNEANLGNAEQRARDALAKATSELEAGRRESNLQRLRDAASLAATAAQGFDAVRTTAQTRRDELQRSAVAELKPLNELKPTGTGTGTSTGSTTATTAKVEPPAGATTKPGASTATPFTPPPALAASARLFFAARYEEAASSLARQRYDTGPAAAQAALLRAASQYSLYLIQGERDAQLLERARQSVAEVRRIAPMLQPDPRAFSPRFIAYFASVR
jgi:hypothetical protein